MNENAQGASALAQLLAILAPVDLTGVFMHLLTVLPREDA
jgi:hypothetical protein